jgi:hypothetical protein
VRARSLQSKDFWAGAIYIALGAAAVWLARGYAFGTASRMGAGFFPTVLGSILAGIGALSLLRAFVGNGSPVGPIGVRPMVLVAGATVLFGLLATSAGFVVALVVLALISAAASRHFRLELRAIAGLALLVALCALVFVKGLGIPLPLLGSWFQG